MLWFVSLTSSFIFSHVRSLWLLICAVGDAQTITALNSVVGGRLIRLLPFTMGFHHFPVDLCLFSTWSMMVWAAVFILRGCFSGYNWYDCGKTSLVAVVRPTALYQTRISRDISSRDNHVRAWKVGLYGPKSTEITAAVYANSNADSGLMACSRHSACAVVTAGGWVPITYDW